MQKAQSRRAFQKADQIARELGRILTEEVADPRLELVTITGARMNTDMSIVEVMYTHIEGKAKQAEIEQGFKQATGFFRTQLGSRLRLRGIPQLRFVWDDFLENMVYAT